MEKRYKITGVSIKDDFYDRRAYLIGKTGKTTPASSGYPGFVGGFFTFDEPVLGGRTHVFFRAVALTEIPDIKTVVFRGVTLKGTHAEVEKLLNALGGGATYESSTKGEILISEMDETHIRNAIVKKLREESLGVKGGLSIWKAFELLGGGARPEYMLCKLDDEDFIKFAKAFDSVMDEEEYSNLIKGLEDK